MASARPGVAEVGARAPFAAAEPWDEHNRALVDAVHPPDWANPVPRGRYNLVVLGAGTAGLVAAAGAAAVGARVALVERDLMGGDCLNVGCVPSKALLRAARAVADARGAPAFGVRVPVGAHADFPAVMARLRRVRAGISRHDAARRFAGLGVDVFLGEGRFAGPDAVEVAGSRLPFRRALIATGARATAPPIPGLAEAGYLTNETVFSLTALPARLAVIGAGPIGCELSQAFARLGAQVTLLEAEAQILGREDRDAAAIVERSLARDGVRIVTGARVERAERRGDERVLHVARDGAAEPLAVDAVLVGVGRAPNVEGLGLERAGVAFDPRAGVRVDDRLRTTNRRVYAAGDVCTGLRFTHHSDFQARLAVQNALFLGRARASDLLVPWCTYTDPEIAHVGLYAREARERGIAVRTFVQPLEDVDRAVIDGEAEGFVAVHVRAGTDRILGATVVARHAGELLPGLTLAIGRKIGLGALARVIHTYPTQAEAIRKLGDAYNRTRLTPLVRRVLATWLRWTR
jgi:pyruvate/2-oxoglutarate dehydrogenase complex dihydrolipoamide dehydrogenase (E3) component